MQELKVELNNKEIFPLEKDFTREWRKILEDKWYLFDKISDGSLWYKLIDAYIATNINSYVCEIKVIPGYTFNLNKIRSNQWTGLEINHNLKCKQESIVVVYSKKADKYTIIPFWIIAHFNRVGRIKLTFTQ